MGGAACDHVLLLGAGGAGAAVAHALLDSGAGRLLVFDIDTLQAEGLVGRLKTRFQTGRAERVTDLVAAAAKADGIVNTTPVGMAKLPGMPIEPKLVTARHWVADIVYFPRETELLRRARALGCRTLEGAGMTVGQAVRAFELFTGLVPDRAAMAAHFEAAA